MSGSYSDLGLNPAWAVPYTAGNMPASQSWSGAGNQPSWWGSAVGTEQMPGADGAWGDKLTKALGDLNKGMKDTQQAGGSGQPTTGSMAPSQSGTGGGGGSAGLAALVQLLQQRYTQLYPGGGSSKGLLGV